MICNLLLQYTFRRRTSRTDSRRKEGHTQNYFNTKPIPTEHDEKSINDFPKATALGPLLKDLDFPEDKQTIVFQFHKEM